ncbi:MAG TPA: recombinase family protein, partial [Candidatus Acidoferrum sp.]
RERHPENAQTVIRFFEEIAAGRSPRAVCADLERDEKISPNGTTRWNFSSLTGGNGTGGMIANELYKGVMVRNQTEQVKDPDSKSRTGKKKKMRPESEWTRVAVPELRIVSDELWEAANRMVKARRRGGPKRGRNPVPRREHMLSGILRCATCNGHMRITNQSGPNKGPRFGCAAADAYRTCEHTQSYDGDQLLAVIRAGMKKHLLNREALAEYTKALHAQRAKNARQNRGEAASIKSRLADLTLELEAAASQFLKTRSPIWATMAEKLALEQKHLEDRQSRIQEQTNVIALHPTAAKAHEAAMRKLIEGDWDTHEHRLAFRTFWSHFVVYPVTTRWFRGQPCPYKIDPVAREDALLGRVDLFPKGRSIEEVVAAHGVPTSGTMNTSGTSAQHYPTGVVALGPWTVAA